MISLSFNTMFGSVYGKQINHIVASNIVNKLAKCIVRILIIYIHQNRKRKEKKRNLNTKLRLVLN